MVDRKLDSFVHLEKRQSALEADQRPWQVLTLEKRFPINGYLESLYLAIGGGEPATSRLVRTMHVT